MILHRLREALVLRVQALRLAGRLPAVGAELAELRAFKQAVEMSLAERAVCVLARRDDGEAMAAAASLVEIYDRWAFGDPDAPAPADEGEAPPAGETEWKNDVDGQYDS